jgi:TolA-binding protein
MATASQISRDPALETSVFWEQYKMPIIAAAVVLVLAGLGFAGYQLYAQRRAADASALLAKAQTPQDYHQVIDRYSGSEAAASAFLLLAEKQRQEKKFEDANATLHKFIAQYPKHELITTAWMGVAANLDSLGKSDDALSTYQRLVAEYPQSYNAPLALLSEVPLLKAKKKTEEARRVCETLLTQYRDSVLAPEALRELQSLPKAAKP